MSTLPSAVAGVSEPFAVGKPVTVEGKSECSLAGHHGGGGIAGITGASSNRLVSVPVLGAGSHL